MGKQQTIGESVDEERNFEQISNSETRQVEEELMNIEENDHHYSKVIEESQKMPRE